MTLEETQTDAVHAGNARETLRQHPSVQQACVVTELFQVRVLWGKMEPGATRDTRKRRNAGLAHDMHAVEIWSICLFAGFKERLLSAKRWTTGRKNYKEEMTTVSKRK